MKVKVGYTEISSSRSWEFDRAVSMSDLIISMGMDAGEGCMVFGEGQWDPTMQPPWQGCGTASNSALSTSTFAGFSISPGTSIYSYISYIYVYIPCCLYHVRLYKFKRHPSHSFPGFGVNQITLLWSLLSSLPERSQQGMPPIDS